MAFVRTKYEADSGTIHPLRLTTAYAAAAGTVPTGAIDNNVPRAQVSKSNREFGLRPRGVRLARLVGTAPNQFYKYAFLPLRSIADFTSPDYAIGETVTINSVSWEIIEKREEDY
jgi:hypothetical protein